MATGFIGSMYGTPLPPATAGLIGILGLAGIAASFLLNARALHRRSSIYRSVHRLPSVFERRWISE
jgi:hypothetical protein